jgi:hypothetical protein
VIPTHDQLQAVVAGLAGLAVAGSAHNRYEAVGAKPFSLGAAWREGYIVSPVHVMGFNHRKLEDERREASEKDAAQRRATDSQVLQERTLDCHPDAA